MKGSGAEWSEVIRKRTEGGMNQILDLDSASHAAFRRVEGVIPHWYGLHGSEIRYMRRVRV